MNKPIFASDRIGITSRTVTDEGYLVAPGLIARTGIQEYRAFELGLTDGDPMRTLRLYRPHSEVFDPRSMATFDGCPITIDHPAGGVTRDNWSELARGDVRGVRREGDFMAATLVVRSKDAIDALQNGKRELSNGYTFTLDMTPGTTPSGQSYDGVQRNIRGNHVALVDAARCGSACRVSDSSTATPSPKGTPPMPDVLRKVVVDGIPVEVSETAAAAIEKLTAARDQAQAALKAAPQQSALDALAAEVKTLKDAAAAKDAEIEALKKDVVTPAARDALVAEWSRLIADGKRLLPGLVTDGKTCHAIRKEVLAGVKDEAAQAVLRAIIGDKKPADLDEADARTAFAALAAIQPRSAPTTDGAMSAALIGDSGAPQQTAAAFDARALWASNLNNVHQE